jgi:magnesium chelatase accessory protein
MKSEPEWEVEGADWPNRSASTFVRAAGFTWHVQAMGQGPVLLLIHGTGAATHSWRALGALLARNFRVIMPDLPGHGFTQSPPRQQYALPRMAMFLAALLAEMNIAPDFVAGHSAGAAIAIRMARDGSIAPRRIISLNGALMPFPGMAAVMFPALARLLFLNPFAAPLLAWRASDPAAVARLIEGTGSHIDAAGLDLYGRLLRTQRHVGAAVGMMANWDLVSLKRDLPGLAVPLLLVAAERDRAVPPRDADAIKALVPDATVRGVKGLGHLAHEEAPDLFARIIADAAAKP